MALTAAGTCSAEELEMCSLKVLEPRGSPTQCLLQLLAERDCTLRYLLGCLERMGHEQACRVLSSAGTDGQRELGAGGEHQGQGLGRRKRAWWWRTAIPAAGLALIARYWAGRVEWDGGNRMR